MSGSPDFDSEIKPERTIRARGSRALIVRIIIGLFVTLVTLLGLYMTVVSYAARAPRILGHEEGVYLGTPAPAISDDTLQDLRHRAGRQRY